MRDHLAAHAGFSAQKEPQHLLLGNGKKPADLLIHDYHQGRSLAVDVSIRTTTANNNNDSPPTVLSKAAAAKRAEYEVSCRANNLEFMPFIMSTFGGHDKDAETLVGRLAATPKIKALYPRAPKKMIWKQLTLRLIRSVSDSLLQAESCHPAFVVSSRRWPVG